MASKKQLRQEVNDQINGCNAHRVDHEQKTAKAVADLAAALTELGTLRRQLSSVREKFQPLHDALYPDLQN